MENKQYCILGFMIVFLIMLVLIERKSSIKIILRFFLTMAALYLTYVIGVLHNINMIFLTILVVFLISFINIFIKEGIHRKAFAEFISVIITSFITGIIVWLVCCITNTEFSYFDMQLNNEVDLNGVEFRVTVIVMLGIFLDIISKISLKLDEEKNKTEDVSWSQQFKNGIIIGKELISEKINMIFLIFAGIIIFPICTYASMGYNFIEILNINYVFLSILITFVGNIGLILSVLITSFCYAILNRKKTIYKVTSENKIDGKRSLKL